ncbi:DUF2564 family protein [Bacillus luteolus]|uniref:DUF2564 family protein n=1 Tax=Litchfieldia luteola TaxID=682179 RepID=A0ABR9QP34_9BACI|nr:DUF2564 family protein [Cytobacillus luteolus]MBE4910171.1 DUF2564 family protein [Cytobacillus luteolus]MBP1942263.1 hypothetical protein [Cytobacillus luteolus]
MKNHNDDITTGFNDLTQVEMSIIAAQKMVGSATMSMDEEILADAARAVEDARALLQSAMENQTGLDGDFLQKSQNTLSQCEHQLQEARH